MLPPLFLVGVAFAVGVFGGVTREEKRQLMLQQLFVEERIRSEGDSGIKQVRTNMGGTRPYHVDSHTGKRIAAIHDHANNERTVGMGEIIAVLNGVEFRTRHNDYALVKPSQTNIYHETEPIKFPDVPKEVTQHTSINDQIREMREWFKAWKDQNTTVRDYRPFFKPVLCYLEGAWTTSKTDVDEPFTSDRHFIDASSWFDLQDKVRFTSYTGGKSNLENYSYLPTKIMNIVNETLAFAQWNYRILCHPLDDDLPLNRLRVVDDLASRMSNRHTLEQHTNSRAARFQLNPANTDTWKDGRYKYGLLDELMAQIPGKDNYQAVLRDNAFCTKTYEYNRRNGELVDLNAGRYHRLYRTTSKDAMGVNIRRRGFSDNNLFVALTTQQRVAGMSIVDDCNTEQKVSYAIPLEIIYLNPLSKWNPYRIDYKEGPAALEVTAGGRNGGCNGKEAYNGNRRKTFFHTPGEFFSGKEVNPDAADTSKGIVCVLDSAGQVQKVVASGTRIILPDIFELGALRQRYPIMPVHGEGSAVWKELEALKDYVMQMLATKEQLPPDQQLGITLRTGTSNGTSPHTHLVDITAEQARTLRDGRRVIVETEVASHHSHIISVRYIKGRHYYKMVWCDKHRNCADGHNKVMSVET